jgi:hypothetical protein
LIQTGSVTGQLSAGFGSVGAGLGAGVKAGVSVIIGAGDKDLELQEASRVRSKAGNSQRSGVKAFIEISPFRRSPAAGLVYIAYTAGFARVPQSRISMSRRHPQQSLWPEEGRKMSPNSLSVTDEVLSVIRHLGQQHANLELTKSFKGMLVHQDVSILEVTSDGAAFRPTNIEMYAALEHEVYLHSQSFPKPVVARLKSINLNQDMFVLSGFAYTDIEWKERRHERVQPKHPTYVNLHWKGKVIRPYVENISIGGMGIMAFKIFESGMRIQPGSNVQLDFQLSPDCSFSALKGAVVYVNTTNSSSVNIGIRLFPKVQEIRLLEKYIAQRKQEILEELNQTYWELSQPGRVENLYF